MKRVGTWFFKIARILLLFYVVAIVAAFLFQSNMLFHPRVLSPDYKFQLKLPFEERRFTAGGVELHSVLVRAAGKARGLILFFHGNAGDLGDWSVVGEEIAAKVGFDVWVVDYPGFGKSGGKIESEAQLYEAASIFYQLGVKEAKGPLVLYGRSLGSSFAIRLAAENKVHALVLESPFLSMQSVASGHMPWLPIGWLLRFPLRSDLWMPKVTAPLLVLHGTADLTVPLESGKTLATLAKQARFVEVEGAAHNDVSDYDLYWTELGAFLNEITSKK